MLAAGSSILFFLFLVRTSVASSFCTRFTFPTKFAVNSPTSVVLNMRVRGCFIVIFFLKRKPYRPHGIVTCECERLGISVAQKHPNEFCSLSSGFAIVNAVRQLHYSVYPLSVGNFSHLGNNTRLRTHDSEKPKKITIQLNEICETKADKFYKILITDTKMFNFMEKKLN